MSESLTLPLGMSLVDNRILIKTWPMNKDLSIRMCDYLNSSRYSDRGFRAHRETFIYKPRSAGWTTMFPLKAITVIMHKDYPEALHDEV